MIKLQFWFGILCSTGAYALLETPVVLIEIFATDGPSVDISTDLHATVGEGLVGLTKAPQGSRGVA